VVSLKELTKNPYKIHQKWEYFFTTDEKPNIDKLVEDIKVVLNFYKRKNKIKCERENAQTDTERLLETSTTLAKGTEYVNREKEIKLLKNVGEKSGDETQKEKFQNAESANAKKFEYEMAMNYTNNMFKRKISSFDDEEEDNDRFTKRVKRYLDQRDESEDEEGKSDEENEEENEDHVDPVHKILNKQPRSSLLDEMPDVN
jgi:hypothetical protein